MDMKKIPDELNGDLAGYIRAKIRDAVTGIDAKTGEVKQEESEIRTEVEKHSGALEAIKRKRRTLARKARKNAEAKVKLKKLDSDQRSIELEAENLAFALEDNQRELADLEIQRKAAEVRACLEIRDGELIPQALKQAEAVDAAIDALIAALANHETVLEWARRLSHNGGDDRSFMRADIGQAFRVLNERLRDLNPMLAPGEKLAQYRHRSYANVLESMAQAARARQPNSQDGEIQVGEAESAESQGVAEAGATATYIQVRPDDPEAPLPGQVWLKSGAQ